MKKKFVLFFMTLYFGNSVYSQNIIFDLDGVLVNPKLEDALQDKFERKLKKYAKDGVNYSCLNDYCFLENLIFKKYCPLCLSECKYKVKEHHLLAWWEMGCPIRVNKNFEPLIKKSIEDCIDTYIAHNVFYKLEDIENVDGFILHLGDNEILEDLAKLRLSKKCYTSKACLVESGVKILKLLKSKPGNKFYIIANLPPLVFEEYKKKFPEVFDCFAGAIISSDVLMKKPDSDIYIKLLTQYHLEAKDCVFIDDEPENVNTAQTLGMLGVVFDLKNLENTLSELVTLKLISQEEKQEVLKTDLAYSLAADLSEALKIESH